MAVDRGELRYNIRLRTGQTFQTLRRFRRELRENRAEFRAFRQELRLGGADARVAARGIRQAGDALESFGASRVGRQALAQQIQDARKARKAFGRIVSELVQIRRELRRVRTESRRTGQSLERTGRSAETAGRRGARGMRRLRQEVRRTRGGADRLAGSFLRMGGIISTFIIARGVIDGIRGLISTSIEFNRTIERSELGIAAILTAVGEVRGAFGETVSQAEQLSLAQAEARRQTQLLRRDALTTAATFTQLIDVFQVALAPGLTGGLDVDEVRRFALRISQAALALGVAQNQLSEEVRSILSGTIRPQTTRIAVALGITNEDIRRVRELGQLGFFLEERFAAFAAAGERALELVEGLVGRVRDGLSQLAGEAGKSVGFFDDVKDSLRGLLDLFLDFDEFGFPVPDPQTLAVLQVFFSAIRDGFNALREELTGITFEEAVVGANTLATAITTAVNLIIGLVQGASAGFSFLGGVIRGVADAVQGVAEALGFEAGETSVRDITRALTSVLVVLISVRTVFGIIRGVILPIVKTVKLLGPLFVRIGRLLLRFVPSLKTIRNLVLATQLNFAALPNILQTIIRRAGSFALVLAKVVGIAALLGVAFREAIRVFTGIALNVEETLLTLAASIERLFLNVARGIQLTGVAIFNFLAGFFNRFSSAVLQPVIGALADLAIEVARIGAAIGVISAETADAITQAATGLQVRPITVSLIDIEKIEEEFRDAFEQNDALFAEIEKRNRERTEKEKSEDDKRKSSAKSASDAIIAGLKLQEEVAESLVELLDRVTSQFSTARTAIQAVAPAVDRLNAALDNLEFQERFTLDPNVAGVAGEIAAAVQREQIALAGELVTIRREETNLDAALLRAAESKVNSQRTLLTFTAQEQRIIREIDVAERERLNIKNEIARVDVDRSRLRAEERSALERGEQAEAAAARARQENATSLIDSLTKTQEAIEARINAVRDEAQLDVIGLQFLRTRLEVLSREASLKESIKLITETITKLEQDSLEVQRRIAEQIAARRLEGAQRELAQLTLQAQLLQDINATSGRAGGAAAERLLRLRAQSAELQVQRDLQRLNLRRSIDELDTNIIRAREQGKITTALDAQRVVLAGQINALNTINAQEEERLAREIERARILSEGTAGEALQVGLEDFANSVQTAQENLAALATSLLQNLASGVGDALAGAFVKAFEQGGNLGRNFIENLREQGGRLLQQLAQQILSSIIENLISNLIASLITTTTLQTTAATTSAVITTTAASAAATIRLTGAIAAGQAEITAATIAASIRAGASGIGAGFSHGGLVGFAEGGFVSPSLPRSTPPSGVARSDNINAYLGAGEFVQRVSAVRHYGTDIMSALNQRLIDPGLLRGLAGIKSLRSLRSSTSSGPGFQEGGLVSENIREAASRAQAQISDQVLTDAPPAVAFPVNEETLELLLAAGPNAVRRFFRDNAADLDGILRGGRTGG